MPGANQPDLDLERLGAFAEACLSADDPTAAIAAYQPAADWRPGLYKVCAYFAGRGDFTSFQKTWQLIPDAGRLPLELLQQRAWRAMELSVWLREDFLPRATAAVSALNDQRHYLTFAIHCAKIGELPSLRWAYSQMEKTVPTVLLVECMSAAETNERMDWAQEACETALAQLSAERARLAGPGRG